MVIRLFFILLILVTAELRTQSLTIGIAANDSRADKNHFFGFDIELMTELCKQINIQCQFQAHAV